MRPVISRTVHDLSCPAETLLREAREAAREPPAHHRYAHHRYMERIEAFHAVEVRAPREVAARPQRWRVAALNAERLTRPKAVRQLMMTAGAQVLFLSEADVGMARSGNIHTIRELAGSSGAGYIFGVEYVELDLGDAGEIRRHAGERNACGLHGNAILSHLAFDRPHVIPLEESGRWFSGFEGAQHRIGGRIAVAARMADAPKPLLLVSLHLESKTDPADRRQQVRHLLHALDHLAPNEACIIGGDFNTKALPREEEGWARLFDEPERHEPLFADLQQAGFSWAAANRACATQRDGPWKTHPRPFGKLDWLFVRGVRAQDPQVIAAVDEEGQPISDHEMIAVDIVF